MKTFITSTLALLSVISIVYGVLVYKDNQIINAYVDDYGISRENVYALTYSFDTCPKEYSAYFDESMGICWNEFAVTEWQDDFTDTDVGM